MRAIRAALGLGFVASCIGPAARAEPAMTGLLTFAFPDEIRVDYGKATFGSERPKPIGEAQGLRFRICDVEKEEDHVRVCGIRYEKGKQVAEVWTATTTDAFSFHDQRCIFRLPPPKRAWAAGDVVFTGDEVLLLICDISRTRGEGHDLHVFSGQLDGSGWRRKNDAPVYRGQDALGLVWDDGSQRLVNYQTTYQKWPKRYPDNMGNSVRRVLHIRTSPDGLNWSPGGSFGVAGPYLPENQLIVPDDLDPVETEFYKFRPARFGDFWAGTLVKYISQPQGLPRPEKLPHGPFSACEWWVSRDGLKWQRPFRDTSDFQGMPFNFCQFFCPPITVNGEYRWVAGKDVYTLAPDRMFFAQCAANTEVTTPVIHPTSGSMSLEVSFESVRLERPRYLFQGYLMAELRTADDRIVPGFERDKCRFLPSGQACLPLSWEGIPLPQPVPAEGVRLKIYMRDMRVYSLRY